MPKGLAGWGKRSSTVMGKLLIVLRGYCRVPIRRCEKLTVLIKGAAVSSPLPDRNAAMRKPKAPVANRARIVKAAIDEFAARRAGCRILDGGRMAVGQAAGAFKLFTGLEPDIDRMDAHFRILVGREG
jgi:hypothetical protein